MQANPPKDYRLLGTTELVEAGDMWCHRGHFMPKWIAAKHHGEQLPYNVYCRKVVEDAKAE